MDFVSFCFGYQAFRRKVTRVIEWFALHKVLVLVQKIRAEIYFCRARFQNQESGGPCAEKQVVVQLRESFTKWYQFNPNFVFQF